MPFEFIQTFFTPMQNVSGSFKITKKQNLENKLLVNRIFRPKRADRFVVKNGLKNQLKKWVKPLKI